MAQLLATSGQQAIYRVEGDDSKMIVNGMRLETELALKLWASILDGDAAEGLSEQQKLGTERWQVRTLHRHNLWKQNDASRFNIDLSWLAKEAA